ncbi:MAG: hypothetical protein ABJZ55_10715 [Fuerstiella sp.]
MTYQVLFFALLFPAVCRSQDFQSDVRLLMTTKYAHVSEQAGKLVTERRFADANKLWLSAVPDDQKTAADYFLLGNVLFEARPAKALEFHQRAAKLKPDVANIQLELGMCLHKSGQFQEAAKAYQAYLQSSEAKSSGPGVLDALLADCLIQTGQLAKACDAWERVPFRSYRINISKFIHKIHGETSPFQRHFGLLTKAREKDINAAAHLILLDCKWDWDWWNVEVKRNFLKADMKELGTLFSAEDPQLRLMQTLAEYHQTDSPNIAQFEKAITNDNVIIGTNPKLPAHGLLASHVTQLILQHNMATPAELLTAHKDRFEAELQKAAKDIDVELVNVYASLLAQTDAKAELARVDRAMWQKTKDARFAASYLVSRLQDGKDRTDQDVNAIVNTFSDHRVVSTVALSLAQQNNEPLTKPLAAAIAAEFQSLTPNPLSGTRTSDRLNALFKALRESLKK